MSNGIFSLAKKVGASLEMSGIGSARKREIERTSTQNRGLLNSRDKLSPGALQHIIEINRRAAAKCQEIQYQDLASYHIDAVDAATNALDAINKGDEQIEEALELVKSALRSCIHDRREIWR